MAAEHLTLASALGVAAGDIVAFVGAGGKTTAMFCLAAEIVIAGGRVVTTTTTRIALEQTRYAPIHVRSVTALQRAIARSAHVLLTGPVDSLEGKALGVAPGSLCNLRLPITNLLIEADGSRRLPFKAPADHEPVIPGCTTLVVPVVGIDAIGKPLSKRWVHRPEFVARIHPGRTVTPEMVAAVLIHRLGGCKNVPAGARVVPLINKIETEESCALARSIAKLAIAAAQIEAVALCALADASHPVIETMRR